MYPLYTIQTNIVTPYLFFTGKGGVGKTSIASSTAVALADAGKRVLLVSTDPASNLQDVFQTELTNLPKAIADVPNLEACNIDPEEAARDYRERVIGPYRKLMPEAVIATMEEQLSGACTVEIAAFDEFAKLLADPAIRTNYDHVLFDTAPTGHTLRLLQLPTAWTGFLQESTHGASCLGPLSGLEGKKELYRLAVDSLSNAQLTTLMLVTRPDSSALLEIKRASEELAEIGVQNQQVIINGLFHEPMTDDKMAMEFYQRQQQALKEMPEEVKKLQLSSVPYVSYSLTGLKELRYFTKHVTLYSQEGSQPEINTEDVHSLMDLLNDIETSGTRVVMTMGKGGVGKTTTASAIAVGLAERGHRVHLTTTDPAAHLAYQFQDAMDYDHLSVSKIDPDAVTKKYKESVLEKSSAQLTEAELAYLKEDLESPCTEEIAIFHAFAEVVERSEQEIVVIDTAPTGHTLLLLDSSEAYHNELNRSTGEVTEAVKKLVPRLRNPQETRVVIVTLAEATPVLEATRLQQDLARADIHANWWIINQSLYQTKSEDAVLQGRARAELNWIHQVMENYAMNTTIIPWTGTETRGYEGLKKLLEAAEA